MDLSLISGMKIPSNLPVCLFGTMYIDTDAGWPVCVLFCSVGSGGVDVGSS